ncbi:hypothetical protein [Enterococcus lactis]|uniref:hypothetical protein n=1 Tax=Enterococcus lactis TaxID=357441 RepID=UPI0022E70792|nr:hypothetical protein [Enterococcus lactis]
MSMSRSRHSKRHEHTGENEPPKRKKKGTRYVEHSQLITLMIAEKYTLPNFMLMVGCGLLIIKTPSALQNMWYSTKVSKGGGLGNLAMMAMFRK